MSSFNQKLSAVQKQSLLCVGLDPDLSKMPEGIARTPAGVADFCIRIIRATQDLVCAYKPNAAFFEVLGDEGTRVLRQVREAIPAHIPVIYDAKRGDIGNTAAQYARAAFDDLQMDAITLSPYMGGDSAEPFLAYHDKAIFLLAKTSNAGAADFQDMAVEGQPLYERVITAAQAWGAAEQIGYVVGATQSEQLARARALAPRAQLLIPGVGTQGGSIDDIRLALDATGGGVIINASRAILYASSGLDFAEVARVETMHLRDALENVRKKD
jgi:orotidine-5'-phosphate decarboxylase